MHKKSPYYHFTKVRMSCHMHVASNYSICPRAAQNHTRLIEILQFFLLQFLLLIIPISTVDRHFPYLKFSLIMLHRF